MSEIRFTKSADGTRIAYTTFGQGPALIEVPRWAQTIEWIGRDEEFTQFYQKLGDFRTVTMVERRGTGASQRDVPGFSMESHVADVIAVAKAAGVEDFDLLGSGDSTSVCIRLAAEAPDRVRRLVLWGSYATMEARRPQLQEVLQLTRTSWEAMGRLIADGFFPNQPTEQARRIAALWVGSVDQPAAEAYLHFTMSIDERPSLGGVRAPTLVLHRENHQTGHLREFGMEVAAGITDARFVIVDGDVGVHQYQHDQIIAEVRKFLGEEPVESARITGPTSLRTVLFTDLVGHTEMMSRLGDERGRAVLREHEAITRSVLKQHGGTEVKTMGDGFMASFGSVTRAVECAVALQKAIALTPDPSPAAAGEGQSVFPLKVRCGLNAGEPIEEEGDLFGATVILASRIAAKAEGGEILVADTVRGLCSGKGFLFADRGELVAKGFEEPVRVYEVRWRE